MAANISESNHRKDTRATWLHWPRACNKGRSLPVIIRWILTSSSWTRIEM